MVPAPGFRPNSAEKELVLISTVCTESILTLLLPAPPLVLSVEVPSMVMLFELLREPFTLKLELPPKPWTSFPGVITTPGCKATRLAKSRLMIARFSISLRETGGFRDQPHFGAGYGCSSRIDHGAGNGTGHGLGI